MWLRFAFFSMCSHKSVILRDKEWYHEEPSMNPKHAWKYKCFSQIYPTTNKRTYIKENIKIWSTGSLKRGLPIEYTILTLYARWMHCSRHLVYCICLPDFQKCATESIVCQCFRSHCVQFVLISMLTSSINHCDFIVFLFSMQMVLHTMRYAIFGFYLKILLCNIFLGSTSVLARHGSRKIFLLLNDSSHDPQFSTSQNMETSRIFRKKIKSFSLRVSQIFDSKHGSPENYSDFFCFFFFFFFPIEGYAFSAS